MSYKGKKYPPKYSLSIANRFANGKDLSPPSFYGGSETNNYLTRLDFKIIGQASAPPAADFGRKTWLYPISSRWGFQFVDYRNPRKRVTASYENFRDYIATRKIIDKYWQAYRNYADVSVGDEVFIYSGEHDRGLIGYAVIAGKTRNAAQREVVFDFDYEKTWLLLEEPVPARLIRTWVPFPRAPLIEISNKQDELGQILPWLRHRKPISPSRESVQMKPYKEVWAYVRAQRQKRRLLHDRVLLPLLAAMEAQGFRPDSPRFERLSADLGGRRDDVALIIEGKVVRSRTGRDEARMALAQALEYRWLSKKRKRRQRTPTKIWTHFSRKPDDDVVAFLEGQKAMVSWLEKRKLAWGPKSADIWSGLRPRTV